MVRIRRIAEHEADTVAGLWDRMCGDDPDGAPLRPCGRRNIARMLALAADHRDTFCLIAVSGEDIVGFVLARSSIGDGLLPGAPVGEIDTLYVLPEYRDAGVGDALADAALARLRSVGAHVMRLRVCAENLAAQRFWRHHGFTPDMVTMSRYPA